MVHKWQQLTQPIRGVIRSNWVLSLRMAKLQNDRYHVGKFVLDSFFMIIKFYLSVFYEPLSWESVYNEIATVNKILEEDKKKNRKFIFVIRWYCRVINIRISCRTTRNKGCHNPLLLNIRDKNPNMHDNFLLLDFWSGIPWILGKNSEKIHLRRPISSRKCITKILKLDSTADFEKFLSILDKDGSN